MKGHTKTVFSFSHNIFILALASFILLYLLSTIWEHPFIMVLQSIMALLMLVTTLIVFPKRSLLLPILLITISIIIVAFTGSSPIALWIGLREMNAIITLVILIGLVSWMINHRPYVKALMLLGAKRDYYTYPVLYACHFSNALYFFLYDRWRHSFYLSNV
ncbi:hypothetical protein [Bacillus sp. AK128]